MSTVLTVPVKSIEVSNTTSGFCGSEHRMTEVGDLINFARLHASGQVPTLRDRIDGRALASMPDAKIAEPISEVSKRGYGTPAHRKSCFPTQKFASSI